MSDIGERVKAMLIKICCESPAMSGPVLTRLREAFPGQEDAVLRAVQDFLLTSPKANVLKSKLVYGALSTALDLAEMFPEEYLHVVVLPDVLTKNVTEHFAKQGLIMDVPRPLVDNQLEYCLRTKSSKFQGDFEQRRVQLMAPRPKIVHEVFKNSVRATGSSGTVIVGSQTGHHQQPQHSPVAAPVPAGGGYDMARVVKMVQGLSNQIEGLKSTFQPQAETVSRVNVLEREVDDLKDRTAVVQQMAGGWREEKRQLEVRINRLETLLRRDESATPPPGHRKHMSSGGGGGMGVMYGYGAGPGRFAPPSNYSTHQQQQSSSSRAGPQHYYYT